MYVVKCKHTLKKEKEKENVNSKFKQELPLLKYVEIVKSFLHANLRLNLAECNSRTCLLSNHSLSRVHIHTLGDCHRFKDLYYKMSSLPTHQT